MYIIVKRKLKDYESWKKMVSIGNEKRQQLGSKGGTVYRSSTDPNEIYLVLDWDDQKSYKDYFDLPEVQQALAETGTTEVVEVGDSFHLES